MPQMCYGDHHILVHHQLIITKHDLVDMDIEKSKSVGVSCNFLPADVLGGGGGGGGVGGEQPLKESADIFEYPFLPTSYIRHYFFNNVFKAICDFPVNVSFRLPWRDNRCQYRAIGICQTCSLSALSWVAFCITLLGACIIIKNTRCLFSYSIYKMVLFQKL